MPSFTRSLARRQFVWLISATSVTLVPSLASARQLQGNIDNSSQWGSSWMDFGQATDFKAGQTLKITLADDGAKVVLVRLLPFGQSPDEPIGIVDNKALAVTNRVVTATLGQDYPSIKQISVNGGERAWAFNLGAGNGPARILTIEVLP
jgi:hypothetical protein